MVHGTDPFQRLVSGLGEETGVSFADAAKITRVGGAVNACGIPKRG